MKSSAIISTRRIEHHTEESPASTMSNDDGGMVTALKAELAAVKARAAKEVKSSSGFLLMMQAVFWIVGRPKM